MSLIENKWSKKECFLFSGMYFPNDTFLPLTIRERNLTIGKVKRLSDLIKDPKKSQQFDIRREISLEDYSIELGESSYEGEGLIALKKNKKLMWILYLENSEEFIDAKFEDGKIIAETEYYPHKNKFIIPIDKPESIYCEFKYEL